MGEVEVTVAVDGRDIAGVEASLLIEDVAVLFVIGAGDGRTAHLEAAECLAVPRQPLAAIVGDLHLHQEWRMPLRLLDVEPRLASEAGIFRLHGAPGAERTHFAHAPSMDHP